MLVTATDAVHPDEFSRCEERGQKTDHAKSLSPGQKTDATINGLVDRALWNDDVLRAIEYSEIAVHTKNGVVYLNGHIAGISSRSRIETALRAIPGMLGIQNNLVLDDRLTLEVATSLGRLEHTYGCKFFTGSSHGVISLNGNVSEENVKSLAEKMVASNPNVRAVINNVRIAGDTLEPQETPFLQPSIGQTIYFLDGVSGVVKQVIINPDNRRVIAMIVRGQFTDQRQDLKSLTNSTAGAPMRLVVLPMDLVRYMTRVSGFLHIHSGESNRYMDFDPAGVSMPKKDWKAPYPYCPDDVLFPVEKQEMEYQVLGHLPRAPFVIRWEDQEHRAELVDNVSHEKQII